MYLFYGSRTFGKVDEIKGVGHVATEFGHVFWFPLVPKESFLVTNEKWNGVEGIPIPMSMKSVGTAYARAVAILFVLASLGAAKTLFAPEAGQVLEPERLANMKIILILGAFALPALIATYTAWFTKADYETAASLVRAAGLDHQLQVMVDYQYGKIDQAQATQQLESGPADEPPLQPDEDCNLESAKYLKQYAGV